MVFILGDIAGGWEGGGAGGGGGEREYVKATSWMARKIMAGYQLRRSGN